MVCSSSIVMSRRVGFPDSSIAPPPNSLVVNSLDDLRNMKGHPTLDVAFLILLLLHLWRRDGTACLVAMCLF